MPQQGVFQPPPSPDTPVVSKNGTMAFELHTHLLDLTSKALTFVATPTAANSTGQAGQLAYDANFLYVCVATNSWKRVAIAAW